MIALNIIAVGMFGEHHIQLIIFVTYIIFKNRYRLEVIICNIYIYFA